MKVWEELKRKWKNKLQKTTANAGFSRSYKNIFELPDVPPYQQFYFYGVFVWKWLWKGFYKLWHDVPAPTIADRNARRQLFRMNMSKAVCAEMAGLIWGEACAVDVSIAGRDPKTEAEDPLNGFVQSVLDKNAFIEKMQEHIEEGLALGGGALKTWAETRHDREGNEIPDSRSIMIGYAMADQFIPLSWDNARIHECVFISRIAKNGYYYTRLEWHKWNGQTYEITNELFRSEITEGKNADEPQDILGVRYPLSELYPFIEPVVPIPVDDELFTYWRTPIANNVDDNSPLGVSIYANALETLHSLDICYDALTQEIKLGKKRIIVPAQAVRVVVNPETGESFRYFDANDEVFVAMQSDMPGDLKITDTSVELRVDEIVSALNAFLSVLCLQVGFSAGTFTFDLHSGLKTATEVVSEDSKTYKTVKSIQKQLRPAIEHLIKNIIDVACLYEVEYEGAKVANLAAGGYNVTVTFDDGITQDRQTNINEGVMLVGAGLLSKFKFLTDPKYGQGLTEEDAKTELARIKEEGGGARVDALSLFGTAE